MPEYTLPLYEGETIKLPTELQHLNKPMVDGTILTEEQKKRYLNMYNSQTNPDYAFQEYPSTPEEAFLNTGTPVFKTSIIKNLITPPYIQDSIFPDLYLYREPSKDRQVVFWGDTSSGVNNGDYSCIMVRDRETAELMACYYGLIDPWEGLCNVIDRLVQLGYFGRIWVEKNNTGYAFYAKAKERERYPLCYVTKTVDKTFDRITQDVGRETTAKTRPILMSEYKMAINNGYIKEADERLIKEMHTFIYNEKGKEEAQTGYHDDAIMTDAIAWQMRKSPVSF